MGRSSRSKRKMHSKQAKRDKAQAKASKLDARRIKQAVQPKPEHDTYSVFTAIYIPSKAGMVLVKDIQKCRNCKRLTEGAKLFTTCECGYKFVEIDMDEASWKFPGGGGGEADHGNKVVTARRKVLNETGLELEKVFEFFKPVASINKYNPALLHYWYCLGAIAEGEPVAFGNVAEVKLFGIDELRDPSMRHAILGKHGDALDEFLTYVVPNIEYYLGG